MATKDIIEAQIKVSLSRQANSHRIWIIKLRINQIPIGWCRQVVVDQHDSVDCRCLINDTEACESFASLVVAAKSSLKSNTFCVDDDHCDNDQNWFLWAFLQEVNSLAFTSQQIEISRITEIPKEVFVSILAKLASEHSTWREVWIPKLKLNFCYSFMLENARTRRRDKRFQKEVHEGHTESGGNATDRSVVGNNSRRL